MAIQSGTDIVIDPASGSGTFLIKAYGRLKQLKAQQEQSNEILHSNIIKQLYAVDIDPFAAHLSAMSLAMRDVRYPTSEMNIIARDAFNIRPETTVFSPYTIKTIRGEFRRKIIIPSVNCFIANPPYTRWGEISAQTRRAIQLAIGESLKKYDLTPGIRGQANEIGIYIDFIVHGTSFLNDGSRLAVIISNSWLQTDYGINFSKYLLDHYQVKAIIDFSNRLFQIPLIATNVLLLVKCSEAVNRDNNVTSFVYVDKQASVDELLNLIKKPDDYDGEILVRTIRQRDISRNEKWINILYDSSQIFSLLTQSPKITTANEKFNVYRGNTEWAKFAFEHTLRLNIGPKQFFNLSERDIKINGLTPYAKPAVTNIRYAKFFTFSKDDWNTLRDRAADCYFFVCHEPRSNVDSSIREYLTWGETTCRTTTSETRGGPKICSESWVCAERGKKKDFFGWYDLGGVIRTSIFCVRYGYHKTRFMIPEFDVALDDAALVFVSKKKMDEQSVKAIAGFLNSNFIQLYIESNGRSTAGGVIALEVSVATQLPIIDLNECSKIEIQTLAELFDALEGAARKYGSAITREAIQELQAQINDIDHYVGKLLGIDDNQIAIMQRMTNAMIDRRLSRHKKADAEYIIGDEKPHHIRRSSTKNINNLNTSLDHWT